MKSSQMLYWRLNLRKESLESITMLNFIYVKKHTWFRNLFLDMFKAGSPQSYLNLTRTYWFQKVIFLFSSPCWKGGSDWSEHLKVFVEWVWNDDMASKGLHTDIVSNKFPLAYPSFSAKNSWKAEISEIWILDVSDWRSFISVKMGWELGITHHMSHDITLWVNIYLILFIKLDIWSSSSSSLECITGYLG